ncbi:MAG: PilZ domain-containing protein [Pseudomonadota bacterium]
MAIEDKRAAPRYRAHWKISIIFDAAEKKPIVHSYTNDLSLSGTAVNTDLNVSSTKPVTVLLFPPLTYGEDKQKTVEIRANLVYTIYSGSDSCFRVGLHFISFKDDGLKALKNRLDRQFSVGSRDEKLPGASANGLFC